MEIKLGSEYYQPLADGRQSWIVSPQPLPENLVIDLVEIDARGIETGHRLGIIIDNMAYHDCLCGRHNFVLGIKIVSAVYPPDLVNVYNGERGKA